MKKELFLNEDPAGKVNTDELKAISGDMDAAGGSAILCGITIAVTSYLACPTSACSESCR